MKAGNIIHFPKAKTYSEGITCNELTTEDSSQFNFSGQVWVTVDKHSKPTQKADFTAYFKILDDQRVEFEVKTPAGTAPNTNYMAL
jgi:hypothetical protein